MLCLGSFQHQNERLIELSFKSCLALVMLCDFFNMHRFRKGSLTEEQIAHIRKLQLKISELERKIKDFETSFPSQPG